MAVAIRFKMGRSRERVAVARGGEKGQATERNLLSLREWRR
jgi:hypothetical protein